MWHTQWDSWLREGRACLPREPYPESPLSAPAAPIRPGDGSPDREREILSGSVRTAFRRAHRDARKRQSLQSVKAQNAVLALDTFGGRPSQLANPS